MAFAMKGGRGSRVPLRYFEEKKSFKNHLESLPDCQNARMCKIRQRDSIAKEEKNEVKQWMEKSAIRGGAGGSDAKVMKNLHFLFPNTSLI